ncbi:hypothetical protein LDO26_01225 [Luteimonas sp. BDR2-5]|uniref:hypothetical protein n=1 Tax=Proluteimonas luteida TaxID=2878685 RepID=UPI001E512299|nr:hypothetical protein [Luteimonas sp. BDR2-5]MCD9026838.1 hypothetical protein [Luteimonas sp. BDR2-5]
MSSRSKSINLFATRNDWQDLLSSVEAQIEFYYVRTGALDEDETVNRIDSYLGLENLGISRSGTSSRDPAYLCVRRGVDVEIRCVEQRSGGTLCFVDQIMNVDSVAIRIGGQFEGNILISGQIGTVSGSEWSFRAFSVFQKEVRKRFERAKSYYVGKGAMKLLLEGWRLTANARSPEVYDLSLT